ncbi:MAG: alpha/beta fold hydrolase [Pseudomonadota bacterium]
MLDNFHEVEQVIGLEYSIGNVFSLMPEESANHARQAVLETYLESDKRLSGAIKWADFDLDGKFQRGGLSELTDLTTRILKDPSDDTEVRRLVDQASQLKLKPGLIEALPDEDLMFWFIPYTPPTRDRMPKTLLRGLSITLELFGQVIDIFNPDASLTPAEKRVCFQFVSGKSLREAAEADDVGVETKRLQIKQAIAKLECDGQSGLARLLVGQMVHFAYVSEGESSHAQVAETFAANHLPSDVRIAVQRLPNGRLLRFYEAGPSDGTPILMIHGFMFPFAPINAPAHLDRNNLRLMMPIRTGYLDERSATNLYHGEDAVEQTIEDLTLFLTQCWKRPVILMGELAGGPIAAILAARNPELVERLILFAINTVKGDPTAKSFAKRFHGGLRQLVAKPTIFRFVAWQFRKFNTTRKAMRTTMTRIMRECPADLEAMEGMRGAGSAYEWLIDFLSVSPVGYADDFRMIIKGEWAESLSCHPMPVDYVHGPVDSLTTVDDVRELMKSNPWAKLHVLEEGGHFAHASHADLVWDKISEIVQA